MPPCSPSTSISPYEGRIAPQGEGVPPQLHRPQAVGERHEHQFVIPGLFGGEGEGEGEEGGRLGLALPAVGAKEAVLDLDEVVGGGVFEADEVVLSEVEVELLEELFDELARQEGTGSHMVNSKLANS